MDTVIKAMTMEHYEKVFRLWREINGFAIRSMDDSKEGIARFLKRNPNMSVVAIQGKEIVGSILCGHDGRRGCLYHVCVAPECRMQGIGEQMVEKALEELKKEGINQVSLIAFTKNDIGNTFWKQLGWEKRQDVNYYELKLNSENRTSFIA